MFEKSFKLRWGEQHATLGVSEALCLLIQLVHLIPDEPVQTLESSLHEVKFVVVLAQSETFDNLK